MALVSLATPLVSETVREKWFDFPRTLWLMVLPLATLGCGFWVWHGTRAVERDPSRAQGRPFAARWRSSCSPSSASPTACIRTW